MNQLILITFANGLYFYKDKDNIFYDFTIIDLDSIFALNFTYLIN